MVSHPLDSLFQSVLSRRLFPLLQPRTLKHLTEELMIFDSLARCTHTILVESTDTVIRNRSKEDDQ